MPTNQNNKNFTYRSSCRYNLYEKKVSVQILKPQCQKTFKARIYHQKEILMSHLLTMIQLVVLLMVGTETVLSLDSRDSHKQQIKW